MSLTLRGTKNEEIVCGFKGPFVNRVLMGDTTLSIEEFCSYAKSILKIKPVTVPIDMTHQVVFSGFQELVESVITGGLFGWIIIPECIKEFVKEFPEYKKELMKKHEQNQIDNLHNRYINGPSVN